MVVPLDLDALDDLDPFEFDTQSAHLFKHGPLGTSDVLDAWESDRSSIQPNHPHIGSWSLNWRDG